MFFCRSNPTFFFRREESEVIERVKQSLMPGGAILDAEFWRQIRLAQGVREGDPAAPSVAETNYVRNLMRNDFRSEYNQTLYDFVCIYNSLYQAEYGRSNRMLKIFVGAGIAFFAAIAGQMANARYVEHDERELIEVLMYVMSSLTICMAAFSFGVLRFRNHEYRDDPLWLLQDQNPPYLTRIYSGAAEPRLPREWLKDMRAYLAQIEAAVVLCGFDEGQEGEDNHRGELLGSLDNIKRHINGYQQRALQRDQRVCQLLGIEEPAAQLVDGENPDVFEGLEQPLLHGAPARYGAL